MKTVPKSGPDVSGPRPWRALQDLIPTLSQSERAGLARSIHAAGVVQPVLVLPDGRIVDGHHRWELSEGQAPLRVLEIQEDDAFALGLALNRHRRHLTPEQQKQLLEDLHRDKEQIRRLALALRHSGMTQEQVATELGVTHKTIDIWENENISNGNVTKANIPPPDFRVKLSADKKEELIQRHYDGESQQRLADDFKISQGRVSQIIAAYEKQQAKAAAEAARGGPEIAYFANVDCYDGLKIVGKESIDLLLTDPPYCTDVEDSYLDFVRGWFFDALSKVRSTGRAYICFGPYPEEIEAYLTTLHEVDRFEFGNILIWTYRNTIGPTTERLYKNNWQGILHLVGIDAPPLNFGQLKSAFSVFDINAPDGRHDKKYHSWQKPDELAERILSHATAPGDTIVDLFAGSGTFGLAAARLGRRSLSFEPQAESYATCLQRGGQAHEG